jgi:hypothetical protein
MTSFATSSPLRRAVWFDDGDGVLATTKREDEVTPWSHDWTNDLASGETVASAAYADSGVTRTNEALASNVTSADVTGIGEFEVTVTTSTSRKFQRVFRYYSSEGISASDYRS